LNLMYIISLYTSKKVLVLVVCNRYYISFSKQVAFREEIVLSVGTDRKRFSLFDCEINPFLVLWSNTRMLRRFEYMRKKEFRPFPARLVLVR
jgi:DNA polymerase III alpha subunit (gram-positive type)